MSKALGAGLVDVTTFGDDLNGWRFRHWMPPGRKVSAEVRPAAGYLQTAGVEFQADGRDDDGICPVEGYGVGELVGAAELHVPPHRIRVERAADAGRAGRLRVGVLTKPFEAAEAGPGNVVDERIAEDFPLHVCDPHPLHLVAADAEPLLNETGPERRARRDAEHSPNLARDWPNLVFFCGFPRYVVLVIRPPSISRSAVFLRHISP